MITLEDAMKYHKELWGWLAETGSSSKSKWPGWREHGKIENKCFMCELVLPNPYDKLGNRNENACVTCPLIWPKTETNCYPCENSIYADWAECDSEEDRKTIAAQIRDLPTKEV